MRENELCIYAREQQIELLQNEPLCDHTTFRIGGPASFFAVVEGSRLAGLIEKVKAFQGGGALLRAGKRQ